MVLVTCGLLGPLYHAHTPRVVPRSFAHDGIDAYDGTTGAFDWSEYAHRQYGWIPAADAEHVYMYMGPASFSPSPEVGTLFVHNRATGNLDYTILNPGDGFTTYRGTVYLGPQHDVVAYTAPLFIRPGGFASFDLDSQSVRWQIYGDYTGQVAIGDGYIYAADDRFFEVLDEATGSR